MQSTSVSFLSFLLSLPALLAPAAGWAHQDPVGCSSTGASLTIETFRADRRTALSVRPGATECETISYRVRLAKPPQDTVCAFEQGSLTIRTPDGIEHDLTPRGPEGQSLIPCLGGGIQDPDLAAPAGGCELSVFEFESGFVDYQVRLEDVTGGSVVASARYGGGLLHINPSNLPNSANATTAIPVRVTACPADTECRDNFCSPELGDGVRRGLCTFTDLAGAVCRPALDVCDAAETCVAGSPACPEDVLAPAGAICRAGSGDACDPDETCDGGGAACPPDVVRPPGVVCRPGSGDACDPDETCPGTSGEPCPPDAIAPVTLTCRPATGACERDETCPGLSGAPCPPDGMQPVGAPCEADGEPCTIEACDGSGRCVFFEDSTAPECATDCGAGVTAPCEVSVDFPPGTYDDLQRAVDTASDGATLTVSGRCTGPIEVFGRRNLTIEGSPPSAERASLCAGDNGGPGPGDLVSTIVFGARPPPGTGEEILTIERSRGITVRNLNIVDGGGACVALKRTAKSLLDCNCVARCVHGVRVHTSLGGDVVAHNLVENHLEDGILLRAGTTGATIAANTVRRNADDGVEANASHGNLIDGNVVIGNGRDGIELNRSHANVVLRNEVRTNGTDPATDAGIELESADDNDVGGPADGSEGNLVRDNADGATDEAACRSGSGNVGVNLPPSSPCR
jgi:parallel beta-helix repeat protein